MMLFIVIYLLSVGADGVSVPQPVVLPPPVPHLRLISADQRFPSIFATNSLHRQATTANLAHLRPHPRRPAPTRLLFEENSHQIDHDTQDYPLHLQRQPDVTYHRPPAPRPVASYYVHQTPANKPEFVSSEETSSNGFPVNLQNPRFEFGFVPLTSDRTPHSIANSTSTRRNVTSFRNNITSSILNFRPLYIDLPQNDVGYSQSEILTTTQTEFNRTFDCGGRKDLNWCDLGRNYPSVDIQHLLSRCSNLMAKLFVEIPNSSNGLTYTGGSQLSDFITANGERKNTNPWSWSSYGSSHERRLCDGQQTFAKPGLAKDIKGKWYVIVQTTNYVQRVPLEICSNVGQSCAKISSCGIKSKCVQKYNYHLLISVDPHNFSDCPFMRLYKFPSICTCHAINST